MQYRERSEIAVQANNKDSVLFHLFRFAVQIRSVEYQGRVLGCSTMDYGDLYRLEHSTHQTTKEVLAKVQAERDDFRDELVKWRRWADHIIGGPGLMPSDKESRDEISRRLKAMRAEARP